MKVKIVWSTVGYNNGDIILIGSFQQSALINKAFACLAIVLILCPASTLYLIPRLVWTLWALTTNSQQPHPVSKHPKEQPGT